MDLLGLADERLHTDSVGIMPKPLPAKLPAVEGDDPVALGFKLAFQRINQIIDALHSMEATGGPGVRVIKTDSGTSFKAEDTTGGGGGTGDDPRWS